MSMPEQPQSLDPGSYYELSLSVLFVAKGDHCHIGRSILANMVNKFEPYAVNGVASHLVVNPAQSPQVSAEYQEYLERKAAVTEYRQSLELSNREREVMDLLCRGLSHGEIADDLGIEVATVRSHQDAIAEKMEVDNRYKMVALYSGTLLKEAVNNESTDHEI